MYHSVACIWIVFSYIWFPYYFYIKGAVTRYCNNDGLWDDPDYTACIRNDIQHLYEKVTTT
jgi:hypothetical protein